MTEIAVPRENLSGQIGVFLGRQKFDRLVSKQYDRGLKELVRAASVLGLCPVWFSLPQVKLEKGLLLAASQQHGEWQFGLHPLPGVVYDRALFNRQDRGEGKKIRAVLAEHGVKYVNTRSAFSKWGTHVILAPDSLLLPHLPHTVCFSRDLDLYEMLSAYTKVCIKSFWGSRGKEVLFVERGAKGLTLLYPKGNVATFQRFEELARAVHQFMGDKECIIQQTIDLAAKQGRLMDIRVLLQKVSLTTWDCTALCLRLALPGRGSTSTGQGGEVRQITPLLAELWPSRYLEIISRVKALAINTAKKLEEQYGLLGELGIDVGIDINGGVWLFEVNGKPGKTTVRRLMQDDLIQQAYQRPLLYAEMLLEEKLHGAGTEVL